MLKNFKFFKTLFPANAATADAKGIVQAHAQDLTVKEIVWTPTHPTRGAESSEFEESKKTLEKKDPECFICGIKELPSGQNFEGHHYSTEWSLQNSVDLAKIQKDFPNATSVTEWLDSIDNLILLCPKCHRAPLYGVHMITMPAWIVQKYQKDGWDLVSGPTISGVVTSRLDQIETKDWYPKH